MLSINSLSNEVLRFVNRVLKFEPLPWACLKVLRKIVFKFFKACSVLMFKFVSKFLERTLWLDEKVLIMHGN